MMSMVAVVMLNVRKLANMVSGSYVRCPFCPCIFVCQSDLDLHLEAFGDYNHDELWRCVHIVLEADGFIAGIDSRGDWYGQSRSRYVSPSMVRRCRRLLSEHGFVL